MFFDNLSIAFLFYYLNCVTSTISVVKQLSELCELCTKEFGSLARDNANPKLCTLEKLCVGFKVTPNELLGLRFEQRAIVMSAEEIRCFFLSSAVTVFPVCPGCGATLEREF